MKKDFLRLLVFGAAIGLACDPVPVRGSDSYGTVKSPKPGTPPLALTVSVSPLSTMQPFAAKTMAENFASRLFDIFKHHDYVGTINHVDTGKAPASGPALAIEIIKWEPGHLDGMIQCKFHATLASAGKTIDLGAFDNSAFLQHPTADLTGGGDAITILLRELAVRVAQTGLVPGFSDGKSRPTGSSHG